MASILPWRIISIFDVKVIKGHNLTQSNLYIVEKKVHTVRGHKDETFDEDTVDLKVSRGLSSSL